MKSGKTSSSQSAPKTKVVDRMLHGCTHLLKANEDDHDTFGYIWQYSKHTLAIS